MDTLDLASILEKYNNKLLNSLQNEFMNSFKEDLLNNIKTEIYNLFINNKEIKNTTVCGFKRTRQRGTCKRTVKGFVCPYHLKQIKNQFNLSLLPDNLPDDKLYGKYIFTNKKEDYINIEKRNISKTILINIKIKDYNKKYLPVLKKVYNDVDIKIYNCKIYNKNINIIDKFENNGYSKLKLIEYNIIDSKIESGNKILFSEQKKKKKKTKVKKVVKINNNINIEEIKKLIDITLNTFDENAPKDEIVATLHILLKEEVKLFKIYINIILSNINLFFKNVDTDVLLKIWKNSIEYVPYDKVLIYNNDNNSNIIEKVFSYLRSNYKYIPQHVKVLWVDYNKNNIIQYEKKYSIDNNKPGIKIYNKDDTKKETPLPIDKITVLYY